MRHAHVYPTLQALLAAVLFGASAPAAKLLLGQVEPIMLAGLLYLGSGLGVLAFKLLQSRRSTSHQSEARLSRTDMGWLLGAVFAGGVAAPILLLFSLRAAAASTASLLLNFEGAATALIAAVVFREAISQRAFWAIVTVTVASILLSWDTNGDWGLSPAAIGILGACVLWGIDNNLTRNLSAKDPLVIVLVKGLGAGTVSVIFALLLGNAFPPISIIGGALALGSFSYGASIVLFIRAMRGLGAARTSAVFSTAPLAGAALSFVLLRETPAALFLPAFALMSLAMLLLLREKHEHYHRHEAITHDHRHRHDDGHHFHDHPEMISPTLTHSHIHTHEAFGHSHPHLPDTHHRHAHAD